MPRCGATFDENSVPPWTRGDFRGVRSRLSGRPSQTRHDNPLKASRPLSFRLLSPFGKGDFQGATMSVKKDASGRRFVQAEVEVPGTPEEVWQAIATGPGVSSWFVPTEAREDGTVVSHFGPGMDAVATQTAWDPPRRFAAEGELAPNGPIMATEWIIEARSGGTCIVRVVHSLFTSSDDWDDPLESIEAGWPDYFRILKLYLTHFRGQPCSNIQLMGVAAEPASKAWDLLAGSLGLADATVGQRRNTPGDAPPLAGVVELTGEPGHPHQLLLRARPAGAGHRPPYCAPHVWPSLCGDPLVSVRRQGTCRRLARRAIVARVDESALSRTPMKLSPEPTIQHVVACRKQVKELRTLIKRIAQILD